MIQSHGRINVRVVNNTISLIVSLYSHSYCQLTRLRVQKPVFIISLTARSKIVIGAVTVVIKAIDGLVVFYVLLPGRP